MRIGRIFKASVGAAIVAVLLTSSMSLAFAAAGGQPTRARAAGFCGEVSATTRWRFNARLLPNQKMHGASAVAFDGGRKFFVGKHLTHFEVNGASASLTLTGKLVGPGLHDRNVYTADIVTTVGSPDTADITVHSDTETLVHEVCTVSGRGHVTIK